MNRDRKKVYEFATSATCAANESPIRYINAAGKESAYRSSGVELFSIAMMMTLIYN